MLSFVFLSISSKKEKYSVVVGSTASLSSKKEMVGTVDWNQPRNYFLCTVHTVRTSSSQHLILPTDRPTHTHTPPSQKHHGESFFSILSLSSLRMSESFEVGRRGLVHSVSLCCVCVCVCVRVKEERGKKGLISLYKRRRSICCVLFVEVYNTYIHTTCYLVVKLTFSLDQI